MRNGGRSFLSVVVAGLAVAGFAGCGGGAESEAQPRATVSTAESTSTTSSSTTTSTTAPAPGFEPLIADPALSPEEQVEAAYLFSWEIYYDAVERGDTSFLELAYSGDALKLVTEEVAELVDRGLRQVGSAELNYSITVPESGWATVVDLYTDRLEVVDAETGDIVEPAPDEAVDFQFTMELVDGSWLVTDIVSYDVS